MPFLKTADSKLVQPGFSPDQWDNFRDRAKGRIRVAGERKENLISRASDIFGSQFDPEEHLLSHCTIVCSVDTLKVPNSKIGSTYVDGQKITRKYDDYRINPECDRFINNNLDAWSRPVIRLSYPTFVGANNFVEHVQVDALSKGRIIDAAVRDIGPSLYVDILVATAKKHADLVSAINSGKMGTLSMGCSVLATICTKCGNVAADDTDLCSHVKYLKGNKFHDSGGVLHRVAELCGHEEMPGGGVQFIEASWVETPAFGGAVLRNVLNPEPSSNLAVQTESILNTPPAQWSGENLKAATGAEMPRTAFNGMDDEEAIPAEEKDEDQESILKKVQKEVYEAIVDGAREKALADLREKEQQESVSRPDANLNDNIQKQASYRAAIAALIKISDSDAEFLDKLALLNEAQGISIPVRVYRAALQVGPMSTFTTESDFLGACRKAMRIDTQISPLERNTLLRLGKLLSLRSRAWA